MTTSSKLQSDVYDGPYFQECQAAAEMSSEQLYWEDVAYWEGAQQDRYDGWREYLDLEGLGEDEEAEATAVPVTRAPQSLVVARELSEDDILF